MDFGSFENTIDKNIETDKASDKFDQQLQAYKDASIYTRKATSIIMILNIIMYLCICVTPIPVFSIILYYRQ